MADVVAVFFVELIVGDFGEAGTPEDKTFFQVETDAFEEQGVLKTAVVFEVGVAAEGAVEMLHTEREGGGQVIDITGGDVGARERG